MARCLLRLLDLAYVHISSTTTSEAATGCVGFLTESEEVPVAEQRRPLLGNLLRAVPSQHGHNLLHPLNALQLHLWRVWEPPSATQARLWHADARQPVNHDNLGLGRHASTGDSVSGLYSKSLQSEQAEKTDIVECQSRLRQISKLLWAAHHLGCALSSSPARGLEGGLKDEPGLLGPPGQGRQGGIEGRHLSRCSRSVCAQNCPQPGKCLKTRNLTCMGRWHRVSDSQMSESWAFMCFAVIMPLYHEFWANTKP